MIARYCEPALGSNTQNVQVHWCPQWSAPDGTCFSGQINLAVSMARGKGEDTTNSTCHAPTANPTSVEGNRIDRKPYIWIEICEEPVDFP
jgi:hypothetical protein